MLVHAIILRRNGRLEPRIMSMVRELGHFTSDFKGSH
jgi:hypothetical protein